MGAPDDRLLESKRLEVLLARYVEERASSSTFVDLEELCREDPELLEALRESVRKYEEEQQAVTAPAGPQIGGALPQSQELGRRLLHYRLGEKLGQGGMGQVYVADDTKLGRQVALKLLPWEMASNHESAERLRREARAIAALNHPNIVTVHSVEEADGIHFLTMELVKGRTLDRVIPQHGLAPGRILQIAEPLVEALVAAHERGIIHRDLKPANIMLARDGRLKVLDFGLAKFRPPLADDQGVDSGHGLTREGRILGTLHYISPEQLQGKSVDVSSDHFSFGILLYKMMTGRRPFHGETSADLIAAILRDAPQPVAELRPDLPVELVQITERCLEKDPKRRYPTTQDLLEALRRARGGMEPWGALVSGLRSTPSPTRSHTVGREGERTKLRSGLEEVAAGRGLLLCVAGEPGIGKSTLIEGFLEELSQAESSCFVARGRCSERLAGTEAYLPFLEVLQGLLQDDADGQVGTVMRDVAPWWYVQVVPRSSDPSLARLTMEAKATTQERMKRELVVLLQQISRRRPVIFAFDDLHWSDASTVDLLAYLASQFETMRLLVVCAYRPEELLLAQHPFLRLRPDLQARGQCREIAMGFLSCEEIEEYLNLEFPRHEFPSGFPLLIRDKTEGSPLFMVDLVRYLHDRGVIAQEGEHFRLCQPIDDIRFEIPASVRGMIDRKIDHLAKDDLRLLVAASVQGHEFASAALSRVLSLDAAAVEERLQALDHDHGFVHRVDEYEFPDRTLTVRYRFVHILYQNALYATLTPTRRASWSQATAEALSGYYGEQSGLVASQLAMLFTAARDFSQAVACFWQAARNAVQVFAYQEAINLARRGLELVESLPQESAREYQEALETALGSALIAAQGYTAPEVHRSFARANELSEEIGDPSQLFRALQGLWMYYVVQADYSRAFELGGRLERVAGSADDHAMQMQAHFAVGFTRFYLGELVAAREHLERGLALSRPDHGTYASVIGDDVRIGIFSFLALVLWTLGYPDKARERSQQAITLARELAHPYGLAYAFNAASWLEQLVGDRESVLDRARRTVALAEENNISFFLATGNFMVGWALADEALAKGLEPQEGEAGILRMRRCIETYHATGAKMAQTYLFYLLAVSYAQRGLQEEARSTVAAGLAAAQATGERSWECEFYRLRGDLALADERDENDPKRIREAESGYWQALDLARAQGAKSFELRAATSLACLWQARGKGDEALALLSKTYGWFTEGFNTRDIALARTLIDEWGGGSDASG